MVQLVKLLLLLSLVAAQNFDNLFEEYEQEQTSPSTTTTTTTTTSKSYNIARLLLPTMSTMTSTSMWPTTSKPVTAASMKLTSTSPSPINGSSANGSDSQTNISTPLDDYDAQTSYSELGPGESAPSEASPTTTATATTARNSEAVTCSTHIQCECPKSLLSLIADIMTVVNFILLFTFWLGVIVTGLYDFFHSDWYQRWNQRRREEKERRTELHRKAIERRRRQSEAREEEKREREATLLRKKLERIESGRRRKTETQADTNAKTNDDIELADIDEVDH